MPPPDGSSPDPRPSEEWFEHLMSGHPDPNQVRFAGTRATVPMLTEPTSEQRQAFDLLGAPIPLTLK